jgi:hypothetical protein
VSPPGAGKLDSTRLAYSGDTRPAPRLIEAAEAADVLIHKVGLTSIARGESDAGGGAGRLLRAIELATDLAQLES